MVDKEHCCVCGSNGIKEKTKKFRIYKCPKCGLYWLDSENVPNISNIDYGLNLDAIKDLREKNYEIILNELEYFIKPPAFGFEIGTARGLFIEAAKKRGYEMEGIEPMDDSFNICKEKGLNVIQGFFPEDISLIRKYNFIIFNDVLEHIPNLETCIEACDKILSDKGVIIINIPVSTGVLFKIARALDKINISDYLQRLWQIETKSPHFYYFNGNALQLLLKKYKYKMVKEKKVNTIMIKGLLKRIQAMGMGKGKSLLLAIALMSTYPIISILPSDTKFFILKKE